jgi:hypothetical protein
MAKPSPPHIDPIERYIILDWVFLFIQVLYIPFIFWFVELGQNTLTYKVTGKYGWIYPSSPYNWFCFESLISWTIMCFVFWNIYWLFLIPRKVNFWIGILITTVVGWASEWVFGATAIFLLGHEMQIWPSSPLVYVSYFAIVWWFMNSLLFYLLVIAIPSAAARLIVPGPVPKPTQLKKQY